MKLKPDEVICLKCKGTGKLKSWTSGDFEIIPECSNCWGAGKLDWIERVMGKSAWRFETNHADIVINGKGTKYKRKGGKSY